MSYLGPAGPPHPTIPLTLHPAWTPASSCLQLPLFFRKGLIRPIAHQPGPLHPTISSFLSSFERDLIRPVWDQEKTNKSSLSRGLDCIEDQPGGQGICRLDKTGRGRDGAFVSARVHTGVGEYR